MRSELSWVWVACLLYAEGVFANTFPVGNNTFGVRDISDTPIHYQINRLRPSCPQI